MSLQRARPSLTSRDQPLVTHQPSPDHVTETKACCDRDLPALRGPDQHLALAARLLQIASHDPESRVASTMKHTMYLPLGCS